MTFVRKLAPAPLYSAALFAAWLVLARSTSGGQVLLGLALALIAPHLTSRLRQTKMRVRRPAVALRYVVSVARDVITSNLEVAWDVVAWRWRRPRAKFVVIPLDLRDPVGLSVLAMVTTIVPGTVWSELALDRSALLLHVWDVGESEETFVARYKARYESPLREIFE